MPPWWAYSAVWAGTCHCAAGCRNCTLEQQASQNRGGHFRLAARCALGNGFPHGCQSPPLLAEIRCMGANFMNDKRNSDRPLNQFLLVGIHGIPQLLDGQHHGTSAVQDEAGNVGILLGDTLGGIQQQQHPHRPFPMACKCFDHGKGFSDGFKTLPFPDAGGVDQLKTMAIALKGHRNGTRGARACQKPPCALHPAKR